MRAPCCWCWFWLVSRIRSIVDNCDDAKGNHRRFVLLPYYLRTAAARYGRTVLSARETRLAESMLGVAVLSAEEIWGRPHILRLSLADGRSAVLKREVPDREGARHALSF